MWLVQVILLLCLAPLTAFASLRNVPADYSQIQQAIDSSVSGDTVLVSPGVYVENISFLGKDILVTSEFMLAGDHNAIHTTIIDGSSPLDPDTGSVVRILGGESPSAILQGFTITGGSGTLWLSQDGKLWREGGGILVGNNSSPTIRNTRVVFNTATLVNGGASGGGGGGIKTEGGSPVIDNNVVANNEGFFGSGILMNFVTNGIVRNNVIYNNSDASQFGGGGIMIAFSGSTATVDNNTVIGNTDLSGAGGGGIIGWGGVNLTLSNNIVRDNVGGQIGKTATATLQVSYSNVEGGYTGTGNFDADPMFLDADYHLSGLSPCVDAGDTALALQDVEDPLNPGFPLWPALGGLRNDVGAYGGPESYSGNFAVRFIADTVFGQAPLTIQFTPITDLAISDWLWDFGDGQTSTDSAPLHNYTSPGTFDVELTATDSTGAHTFTQSAYIGLYADTLIIPTVKGAAGEQVDVEITVRNYLPLAELRIPLSWAGPLSLPLPALSVTGLRSEAMSVSTPTIDPINKRMLIVLQGSGALPLEPGTGAILTLTFDIPPGAQADSSAIAITPFGPNILEFSSLMGDYSPTSVSGYVVALCCQTAGDADNSGSVSIGDVTFLIARIFSGGPAPSCNDEGDANGDNGLTIGDVTYLIAHIFSGGPAPVCGTTGS